MEIWQRMILDPACYTLLGNMYRPRTKEKIADRTGIREERCSELLERMKQEGLVEEKVVEGTRLLRRSLMEEEMEELREDLLSTTIGGTRDAIEEGDYLEALEHFHADAPVEGERRVNMAKVEAMHKLSSL